MKYKSQQSIKETRSISCIQMNRWLNCVPQIFKRRRFFHLWKWRREWKEAPITGIQKSYCSFYFFLSFYFFFLIIGLIGQWNNLPAGRISLTWGLKAKSKFPGKRYVEEEVTGSTQKLPKKLFTCKLIYCLKLLLLLIVYSIQLMIGSAMA